jgi:hypothetical protein
MATALLVIFMLATCVSAQTPGVPGDVSSPNIVIEAHESTSPDTETWKPSANAQSRCAITSFEPVSLEDRAKWDVAFSLRFDNDVTIKNFVGGNVKRIRVTHYRSPSGPKASQPTPSELQQEVRNIWLGTFHHATCQIIWAEGALWNIRGIVEHDDGKRSSLMSDGLHVEVQDRNGKFWFIRLRPAVD